MTNSLPKPHFLIVIVGPTAVGKSAVSLEIAHRLGAEILSCDSRQIFRGLNIGTAKVTPEEQNRIQHHFISEREITENYTAGQFEQEALARLEKLFQKSNYAVMVGGSGLYMQAVCEGIDALPHTDSTLRNQLNTRYQTNGLPSLLEELQRLDPHYYEQVDRNNPNRIIRALEVCLQTGLPYSELRKGTPQERPFQIVKIGLDLPREILYERINRRVDQMIAEGLEAEARTYYPYREQNALKTVGYQEWRPYFEGKATRSEVIELIKRNSRRYAKRQMTWFRRDSTIEWFPPNALDEIENFAKKFAE